MRMYVSRVISKCGRTSQAITLSQVTFKNMFQASTRQISQALLMFQPITCRVLVVLLDGGFEKRGRTPMKRFVEDETSRGNLLRVRC